MDLHELYRTYLKIADPTEYKFAQREFGGWKEWEDAVNSEPINTVIDGWRRELDVKLRCEALYRIMEVANNEGTRDSLQANKYLLEANFSNKEKVGRPTKEAIATEARKMVALNKEIKEDADRLFGVRTDSPRL